MKDIMIIFHNLGIVLTLGSSIFFLIIRKDLYKTAGEAKDDLYKVIAKYQRMAHIGMSIMLLTGGYLMTPYWSILGRMHMLHVKMLVFVLWLITVILLSIMLRKARTGKGKKCDSRMVRMNYASLTFGVIIIYVAVSQFH